MPVDLLRPPSEGLSAAGGRAATVQASPESADRLAGASWPREGTGLTARALAVTIALAAVAAVGLVPVQARAAEELPSFVRAWGQVDLPLEERVEATRTSALELGLRNVEPGARILLVNPPRGTSRIDAARMAVRLAPDLPAAHTALARALWVDELSPLRGTASAFDGLLALRRNLEASLWLHAVGGYAAALALAVGSIFFLALLVWGVAREAAHDLGDRLSTQMPAVSRAALLGTLLLLPAALGEGVLGLCLGFLVVLGTYGTRRVWIAAATAAVLLLGALHVLLDDSARALVALEADTVALAAHTAENGLANPMHLARLERAAATDPLAGRALAAGMKRTGDLAGADARYAVLLGDDPDDPVLLNNAANVRLALGDTESAIALYRRALGLHPSATIWFNLSQAWGVALNVVELDSALAKAQALDPDLVQDLSSIQERAVHFVADLTAPTDVLRDRLLMAADARGAAAAMARPVAPGGLGRDPLTTGVALAAALGLGIVLQSRFRPSRACPRCVALVCPRCDGAAASRGVCEACDRLLHRKEGTDPTRRSRHAEQLARNEARRARMSFVAALLVPGAAPLRRGRVFLALLACVAAATVVAFAGPFGHLVPDPLAAGGAADLIFVGVSLLAASIYAAVVSHSLLQGSNT